MPFPLFDVGPVSNRVRRFWQALNTGNRPEALRLLREMRVDYQRSRFRLVRATPQVSAIKTK